MIFQDTTNSYYRGDLVVAIDNTADNSTVAAADEVMRITRTGRVGIGTDSPDSMLHLESSVDYNPTLTIENTNANSRSPFLSFKKSSASPANNDNIGRIEFYGRDATTSSRLMAFIEGYTPDVSSNYDGGFKFSQMINAVQTEVIKTDGAGNLFLGQGKSVNNSNTSDTELNIYGGENASALISLLADNADNTADYFAMMQLASGNFSMGHHTGGGWNDALVIGPYASGDNVGIGTNSPGYKLDVDGDARIPVSYTHLTLPTKA